MPENDLARRIDAVRRFNRFYTQRIGVLHEHLLQSVFSLAEVRVLYELANWPSTAQATARPTATQLAATLGIDEGYLSRILRNFEKRGLIKRKSSTTDARQNLLSLSEQGRKAFAPLNARSRDEVGAMLGKLSAAQQQRLIEAMHTIEALLDATGRADNAAYVLRPHQPGDVGWVIHRHGALYAQEYGYDEQFEALVADIAAKFILHFDPKRERCWIAERDGEIVGSVFVVRKTETVAKLRLLLVEPKARGLGIGARLVTECVRFARQAGYRKLMLWTQSELHAARRIYTEAGFRLVAKEAHHSFGKDLVGETWELKL